MARALRIAVVAACPFPARRGTPVRVQRLSEALAARGHRVKVFTYSYGDGSPLAAAVEVSRSSALPGYGFLGPGPTAGKLLSLDWLLACKTWDGLRREPFDLIYAHHYEGLIVALLTRPPSLPLVYDAHTLLETELPSYRMALSPSIGRHVGRTLDRWLPAKADFVVAVSQKIADRLAADAGLAPDRVCVAGNGVEPDFFALEQRPPRIGEPAPRIVFTGNLGPYQGIKHLIASFALVAAQVPAARLQLITNDDAQEVATRLAQLGLGDRVEVTVGSLDELPGRLAKAHVAVNPRAAGDGVPQKLLNYMAAGVPIVSFAATAVGLRHEVTGLLVPNGDPVAMAAAILRCLQDPELAHRLGAAARDEARRSYCWAGSAAVLEAVFERIAAPPRRVEAELLALEGRTASPPPPLKKLPATATWSFAGVILNGAPPWRPLEGGDFTHHREGNGFGRDPTR